jgi:hypothetical protein
MQTNISISPHTYSSRDATSQPATKGKNRRGEEYVYTAVRVGNETEKGEERMCIKK